MYGGDPWGSYAEYYSDMDYISQQRQGGKSYRLATRSCITHLGPYTPTTLLHNYEAGTILLRMQKNENS